MKKLDLNCSRKPHIYRPPAELCILSILRTILSCEDGVIVNVFSSYRNITPGNVTRDNQKLNQRIHMVCMTRLRPGDARFPDPFRVKDTGRWDKGRARSPCSVSSRAMKTNQVENIEDHPCMIHSGYCRAVHGGLGGSLPHERGRIRTCTYKARFILHSVERIRVTVSTVGTRS